MDKTSRKNSNDVTDEVKKFDNRRTSIMQFRRSSRFSFARTRSIINSQGGLLNMLRAGGHKFIKYENTYRLKPKSSERLNQLQVNFF